MSELKPCPFCGGKAEGDGVDGETWNTRPLEDTLQQKYDTLILEIKKAEEKIQEEDTKAVALYRERDSAGFSTACVGGLIDGLEITTKIINELLEEK